MKSVLKVVLSLAAGLVGFGIWLHTLGTGAAVYHAFAVVINSSRQFNRSRGSLFDVMHYQAMANNPLQGYIDPELKSLLISIAVFIAVMIIIGGLRAQGLKKSCGVNLLALTSSMGVAVLVTAVACWFLGKDASQAFWVLIIGSAITMGLKVVAGLLLKLPESPQLVLTPAEEREN